MDPFIVVAGFVMVGVTLEIFFTSIVDFMRNKDVRLPGVSYLWMFPIYAVVPLFFILGLMLFPGLSIFIRALFYMLMFYLWEYISGYTIKKIVGKSPWDYSNHKIRIHRRNYSTNLHGLVCLEYAPIWYAYGIIGEYYFLFLMHIA